MNATAWLAQERERDAEFSRQRRKWPPLAKGDPRAAVAQDAAEIFGKPLPTNQHESTHKQQ
jgi:hypothetical protein